MKEITLTGEQRKELVLSILTDAIIFERTAEAVNNLLKVSGPNKEAWEAESQVNSIANTYTLMGLPAYESHENEQKYLPVADILRKIFDNTITYDKQQRPLGNQRPAHKIAEEILEEWEGFLNNTNLRLQKAS